MPCYINPEAQKAEREACFARSKYLEVCRRAGLDYGAEYDRIYAEQLAHRKQDRDYVVEYLEATGGSPETIASLNAMTDMELVMTSWETWTAARLACPFEPHTPRVDYDVPVAFL